MRNKRENRSEGQFPPGWDRERVLRILELYENQSEEEAVAEDEAAFATELHPRAR